MQWSESEQVVAAWIAVGVPLSIIAGILLFAWLAHD